MIAYYNEFDPFAAAWLAELMADGLIAAGDIDTRSITEVKPDDLEGYDQCHFFAGIGGWSLALRLAGWPDGRPVWTGSCPCQPFSTAGSRGGADDERHLWPAFYRLIAERRPATVFGEQVASRDGRTWLAAVRSDLEAVGYAVGAADLCAAGAGAPHIRQRLFWVADSDRKRWGTKQIQVLGNQQSFYQPPVPSPFIGIGCVDDRLGRRRPVKSGICIVAHGFPNRVGMLRGAGNAIVPQLAAAFIIAARKAISDLGG
jgi:DNA (cytosine-5)-methyltransferase 1